MEPGETGEHKGGATGRRCGPVALTFGQWKRQQRRGEMRCEDALPILDAGRTMADALPVSNVSLAHSIIFSPATAIIGAHARIFRVVRSRGERGRREGRASGSRSRGRERLTAAGSGRKADAEQRSSRSRFCARHRAQHQGAPCADRIGNCSLAKKGQCRTAAERGVERKCHHLRTFDLLLIYSNETYTHLPWSTRQIGRYQDYN